VSKQLNRRQFLKAAGLSAVGGLLAACTPQVVTQVVTQIVEQTKEVQVVQTKVVEQTKEVVQTQLVQQKITPLFWDATANKCGKTVKLSIATHGDFQSRDQDALFAVGVLQNQWQQLNPCIQVETQVMPQGTSPNIAVDRWTAGTAANVVFTWVDAQTAGTQNKWVLPLEDYFKQKNPYSDNATWYNDFLFPEVYYAPFTDGHTYWVRPGVRPGSNGVTALFYNQDLLKAAGVADADLLPKTWTDWFVILDKIKKYGKTPFFLPLAGNTLWEWSGWMVSWIGDYFSGNLSQDIYKIMTDGTENAQGTLSQQKLVKAVLDGKWDLNDPRAFEFFDVSSKLFDYLEPGYGSVPDMVAETPTDFLKGNVGYCWAGTWRVSTVSRYPGLPFTWGTAWLPKPDAAFSKYATDHYNQEQGQGSATCEMVHMAISSTTAKDPDVLKAAVDFAMYLTSPSADTTWCTYQSVPCTEPGTSFDDIVGTDAAKRLQLYGFYNPPRDGKYVATNVMTPIGWVPGSSAELNRRFTEYKTGKMTKDAFISSMMKDIIQNAKDQCTSAIKNGVKGWDFCTSENLK
jgi:ABC-type glycerol-3-phosphate transport system substrate-binding protein